MAVEKPDPDERFVIEGDPEDALRGLLSADLPSEPPPGLAEWQAWWKREGRDQLNALLLEHWNPIGDPHVPSDEYATYAGQIARLLREGSSVEQIAAYLEDVETRRIGVRAAPENDRRVAALLVAWHAASTPAAP